MLIASGSNAEASGRVGNGKVVTDALPKAGGSATELSATDPGL